MTFSKIGNNDCGGSQLRKVNTPDSGIAGAGCRLFVYLRHVRKTEESCEKSRVKVLF
jgi:hypothetical protein